MRSATSVRLALAAAVLVPVLGCSDAVSESHDDDALDTEVNAFYEHVPEIYPSLDVCDRGGDQQRCHTASATYIDILLDHRQRFRAIDTDRASRDAFVHAFEALIAGFERRNRGLETHNDADVVGGNDDIATGNEALDNARQEWVSETD